MAVAMPDGRYAILVSDTRPGDFFVSKSLDGPWEYQGPIKVDANGFSAARTTANLSIIVRPDNNFRLPRGPSPCC